MSLQIIGAAYPRTGTLSLKFALEELGLGPCYHMREVIEHPEAAELWMAAADGHPDWAAIFKNYKSTVDAPGCFFWRELHAKYPDAKVILTLRDPDKWFESTQATVFSLLWVETVKKLPLARFFQKLTTERYGDKIHDHDFMVDRYKRYCDDVRKTVPRGQLLEFESSDGWEPLCKFLGVPVPSTRYPKTNAREELRGMMEEAAKHEGPLDMAEMAEKALQRH